MSYGQSPVGRAEEFCRRFGINAPILLAPMAGACPPALSVAVGRGGGMGGCGAVTLTPTQIIEWAHEVRAASNASFQINLWLPDPPPEREPAIEAGMTAFLTAWRHPPPPGADDFRPPDFDAQFDAVLEASPAVLSTIMGVLAPDQASALRRRGIAWFATVTTPAEARQAEQAGADAIVAQGAEAGGHRGTFDAAAAEATATGLFALLPELCETVAVPVVAAGGIADARTMAAALVLGASAVQIGTGFLRTPEAAIAPAWAGALASAKPADTMLTRAFSGRLGRCVANDFAKAAAGIPPCPYPVQRGLTAALRGAAVKNDDIATMQAWAGQAARLAEARPAADLVAEFWEGARALLR